MPDQHQCGPCTACCQGWLRIRVGEALVAPGHPCPHIGSRGCAIYTERPHSCKAFNCAWLINDLDYPDWLRPDNAKVILKYIDIGTGTNVIGAIPTGTKVPPRVLNFLKELSRQHNLPVLHFERRKEQGRYLPEVNVTGFGPPGMQHLFARIENKLKGLEQMADDTPPGSGY